MCISANLCFIDQPTNIRLLACFFSCLHSVQRMNHSQCSTKISSMIKIENGSFADSIFDYIFKKKYFGTKNEFEKKNISNEKCTNNEKVNLLGRLHTLGFKAFGEVKKVFLKILNSSSEIVRN